MSQKSPQQSLSNQPFYITTTLPYVNSDPHIGFAMEFIRADIIARYQALSGRPVFFNTGTDEHGIKIYRKATEAGKTPQQYVDEYAAKFRNLVPLLGISPSVNFIRTTDPHHVAAAAEFWKRCDAAGDIYKKTYKVKYCVGCELEKTESELVDGRCPIHPKQELEIIEEENYFFRFSKYQSRLLELYEKTPDFVIPSSRLGEILSFVERGLEDFSISRLASKMPWGVPVPGDSEQVMYVWFDALVNYISAIGWPADTQTFETWWNQSGGVVQYCGKDNLRQQSAMWQAMLMSAGVAPSRQIIMDGFITSGGKKMSKSEGNVIDPVAVVREYDAFLASLGADVLRYYVARELSPFEDSDFTMEKFKIAYNAHLANGLGNLVSRIMKMASAHLAAPVVGMKNDSEKMAEKMNQNFPAEFSAAIDRYDIQAAMNYIWERITALDATIQTTAPFKIIKTDKEKGIEAITALVKELYGISELLRPIMPQTALKIQTLIHENKASETPLFPRYE